MEGLGGVDDEAVASSCFFDLFDDNSQGWNSLPDSTDGLQIKWINNSQALDKPGSCETLLVAFSSTNAHFDFEGSLARYNRDAKQQVNGLLVTDLEMTWFLRGGYGNSDNDNANPYTAVTSLVSGEISSLKPKNLAMFGYCRGGYAAIRVGVALGASHIMAFSPQVFINPKERRRRLLPRAYFDWYLEQIQRCSPPPYMDSLVSVLANCEPIVDANIQVHAGVKATLDVTEVNMLADEVHNARNTRGKGPSDACIHISVHTHIDCGHELPLDLKLQNKLDPLIERFVTQAATGS